MPRVAHNKRLCVAIEDYEDTTIYFYNHDIFDQTSIAGPTDMTWPLEQDYRDSEEIAKEIFEEFYPQEVTCRLPDLELSCDLSYEVEASGNVPDTIVVYTITKQGNPLSIRLAMRANGEEIASMVLLQRFKEWFEAVLPVLVRENVQ